MIRELDKFYLSKPEPVKACLLALRHIILQHDEFVFETVKYGMPCFCYQKKMFCYLWTDKKTGEAYILFVEGKHLKHSKLEAGSRARMKVFNVNPNKDLPIKTLQSLLKQALDLYRTGVLRAKHF